MGGRQRATRVALTHISEEGRRERNRSSKTSRIALSRRSVGSHTGAAPALRRSVVAANRYLDASVEQIDLPLGFGSRHLAAASISQRLGAVAIVVSESGVVRVFHRGQIEATLIPELWLLDRHHTQPAWLPPEPSKRNA
jgi:DNA integrity scanning protein DisA with diadenylate cyclase activity